MLLVYECRISKSNLVVCEQNKTSEWQQRNLVFHVVLPLKQLLFLEYHGLLFEVFYLFVAYKLITIVNI